MPDRLTQLRNLRINRVAFVPAGDNPRADVLIVKEKPEPSTGADLYAAHVQLSKTIERLAMVAYPDARTTEIAAARYIRSPEGRALHAASSTIHQAARRG